MLEELHNNLIELNLERTVDFGHSFSTIPEMRSLNDNSVETLAHGQAVILDVLVSCSIAVKRKQFSEKNFIRIINIVEDCELKISHPYFKRVELF